MSVMTFFLLFSCADALPLRSQTNLLNESDGFPEPGIFGIA